MSTRVNNDNIHESLENVTEDFKSKIIPLGGIGPSFLSLIVTEGSGYTFDSKIELSNTPDIEASWIEKSDTVETGIDDDPETGQGVGYEINSGAAYCRFDVSNITGTLTSVIVTSNKA